VWRFGRRNMSQIQCSERPDQESGLALMGAMIVSLILVLVSVSLLDLLWRESLSAHAGEKAAVAQQVADAAGEMVVGWFHSPHTVPVRLSAVMRKRLVTADGVPTYFNEEGRSQFVGTADIPDVVLDASNPIDDQVLNDPDSGAFRPMLGSGTVRMLKVYAPSRPGLLCTVDVTVETRHRAPFSQSLRMELEAIELPPLRAGMQSGDGLRLIADDFSISGVHWGPIAAGKDLVIRRIEDLPALNPSALITGQSYNDSLVREDRWMEIWVGEHVVATDPLPDFIESPILPPHIHDKQNPSPGIRLDRWNYDELKHMAMRFGSYYGIDSAGYLYPDGIIEPGRGVAPEEVFSSRRVGDQLGLIFVDTLDRTAPRGDNLGTVRLAVEYFEGVAVIQGHVLFGPTSSGRLLKAQAPSRSDGGSVEGRETVSLTGVHLNGVLYAAGDITIGRAANVYGAVIAEGRLVSGDARATLEVWHNEDLSHGLFRGIPLVYRAPGTWSARY